MQQSFKFRACFYNNPYVNFTFYKLEKWNFNVQNLEEGENHQHRHYFMHGLFLSYFLFSISSSLKVFAIYHNSSKRCSKNRLDTLLPTPSKYKPPLEILLWPSPITIFSTIMFYDLGLYSKTIYDQKYSFYIIDYTTTIGIDPPTSVGSIIEHRPGQILSNIFLHVLNNKLVAEIVYEQSTL